MSDKKVIIPLLENKVQCGIKLKVNIWKALRAEVSESRCWVQMRRLVEEETMGAPE